MISTAADTHDLGVGQFVEFRAQFRASEFGALLEIMTPELAGAIARHRSIARTIEAMSDEETWEDQQRLAERGNLQAQEWQELAHAALMAIRTDFRTDATAEVYGAVQFTDTDEKLTATTLCDIDGFTISDHDRILDGTFTVLGKVTSPISTDVPILDRNKLLSRLTPEAVDELLKKLTVEATAALKGKSPANFEIASRVTGDSLRILPVAIFV